MQPSGRKLRLRVGDAALADVATGRARLSPHLLEALDLEPGELVRVRGQRAILATATAAEPEDEGLDLVRLDGLQRRRAGIQVGDIVEIEPHQLPAASYMKVMTVGRLSDEVDGDDLRRELSAQPIIAGDTVTIARETMSFAAKVNILGLTVAEVVGDSTGCGALLVRVLETRPAGAVQVTAETEIEVVPGSGRSVGDGETGDGRAGDSRAGDGDA